MQTTKNGLISTIYLQKGIWDEELLANHSRDFGYNIKEYLENILETIEEENPGSLKSHNIKLTDIMTQYDEIDPEFTDWVLDFTSIDIGIGDINQIFLSPLMLAFDMNGIDQVFRTINISHIREYSEETGFEFDYQVIDYIRIIIRAYA